jgi:hypothetical protein
MIVLNDPYYLHGPVPGYGAPEDRWYTGEDLYYMAPQYDQRYTLQHMMSANLTTLDYQRNDDIDDQKCKTYTSTDHAIGAYSATVFNGGNIRAEPNLQGKVLGQIHVGQRVVLLYRTADFRWFYISSPEAIGWVRATLLTFDREVAENVPIYREESGSIDEPKAAEESNAGSLNAVVYNGGNLREAPNTSVRVLDQINAKEPVALLGKRGSWYKIRSPISLVSLVRCINRC